mmetsp:Transcript_24868/g.52978  ORF Transcript_24868/g.52978 Transcript_24868/m.52978 type:complete len:208 (-) Transcript_24868:207-830(-)
MDSERWPAADNEPDTSATGRPGSLKLVRSKSYSSLAGISAKSRLSHQWISSLSWYQGSTTKKKHFISKAISSITTSIVRGPTARVITDFRSKSNLCKMSRRFTRASATCSQPSRKAAAEDKCFSCAARIEARRLETARLRQACLARWALGTASRLAFTSRSCCHSRASSATMNHSPTKSPMMMLDQIGFTTYSWHAQAHTCGDGSHQ